MSRACSFLVPAANRITVVGDIVGPLVPEKHWESNR